MSSRPERCPQASRVPSPSQEQWTPQETATHVTVWPIPRHKPKCSSFAVSRPPRAQQGTQAHPHQGSTRRCPRAPTAASSWPWDAPPTEGSGAAGRHPPVHPVTGLLGLGPVWGFAHMLPQFPQLFLPKPRTREVSSSPLHLEPTHRGQRAKGKGCDGPTHLKALSTPGGGHGAVPFQVCGHRPLVPWTTGDPCSPPWLPVSSSASRRLPRDESAQAAVVGARASTSTSGLFSLAPLLKKKRKKKKFSVNGISQLPENAGIGWSGDRWVSFPAM